MTTANIDIDYENSQITEALKKVSGYLDCEKVIIKHIHRLMENGQNDIRIEQYLKTVIMHLENNIEATLDANEQMNHRFVIGFIHTLLRTPAWKSWMQSIQQ
ncbi:hypothetical protein [Paraflavitalea sp. CAU 1676]|uniref:hypothetical protein n=1 Tax=Paraflavitalea sp. CAU 1676 TaxID=3032598 RepID=UPI0023DC85F6|nr:hypothetical protein [Paraflavitalea sp. CAU 1676]MDF2191292.1 hypothetical protein [Paraflavitalea sp. CAU 1676]